MLGSMTTGGGSDQVVTVRPRDVKAVYDFATSDEFVAAAMNKIERSVLMGGLSVRLKEFGRQVKLSDDHQVCEWWMVERRRTDKGRHHRMSFIEIGDWLVQNSSSICSSSATPWYGRRAMTSTPGSGCPTSSNTTNFSSISYRPRSARVDTWWSTWIASTP